MATIKEIAKLAGVGPTTVSNVIHGNKSKVSEETFAKVQKIIDDLHFAPNLAAAMLAHNTTHIVGIVLNFEPRDGIPPLQDPYISALVGAIEHELQQFGYYAMLYSSIDYEKWIKLISTWNMAGLIVLGVSKEKCRQLREKSKVPVVFIDSYLSDNEKDEKNDDNKTFYNIGLDDLEGTCLMTEYLIKKGHKKIAFLADREEPRGVDAFRLIGFKKVMETHGLKGEYICITRDKAERERIILNLVSKKQFTALSFASDFYASEAIHLLLSHNFKLPDDVSITGFDDNRFSQISIPEITTIHQNVVQKGNEAVKLLLKLLKKEEIEVSNIRLGVSLVERNSVRDLNE